LLVAFSLYLLITIAESKFLPSVFLTVNAIRYTLQILFAVTNLVMVTVFGAPHAD